MIALILAAAVLAWAAWRYWPNSVDTGLERKTYRIRRFYQSAEVNVVENFYQ